MFALEKERHNDYMRQEEQRQAQNTKVAQQAEKTYGFGAKISQFQWDEAASLVDQIEREERRRQDEAAARAPYNARNGTRQEYMGMHAPNSFTQPILHPHSAHKPYLELSQS